MGGTRVGPVGAEGIDPAAYRGLSTAAGGEVQFTSDTGSSWINPKRERGARRPVARPALGQSARRRRRSLKLRVSIQVRRRWATNVPGPVTGQDVKVSSRSSTPHAAFQDSTEMTFRPRKKSSSSGCWSSPRRARTPGGSSGRSGVADPRTSVTASGTRPPPPWSVVTLPASCCISQKMAKRRAAPRPRRQNAPQYPFHHGNHVRSSPHRRSPPGPPGRPRSPCSQVRDASADVRRVTRSMVVSASGTPAAIRSTLRRDPGPRRRRSATSRRRG